MSTYKDCRYGEYVAELYGVYPVVWDKSYADYQGEVNALFQTGDNEQTWVQFYYGSCSGCDEWEDRGLNDAEIVAAIKDLALVLPTSAMQNIKFEND